MAMFFNPDDFGNVQNCLMFALTGKTDNPKRAEEIFRSYFSQTQGNGSESFERMCKDLCIEVRKAKIFSEANIAIAWYIRKVQERDYEGFYHIVAEYPDYHVIRKIGDTWKEKNGGFRECEVTVVSAKELAEWSAGSTSETQIAYYVI